MAETIEELPPVEEKEEEEPREEPPKAEEKPKRVRKKPEPPPPPPSPEPRGRGRPRKPDEELKRPRGPPRKPREKKPEPQVELSPEEVVSGDNLVGRQPPSEDASQQDLWRLARLFGSRLGDIQQESKHIKREKTRTLFRNNLLV
jgi:hypothetical protein